MTGPVSFKEFARRDTGTAPARTLTQFEAEPGGGDVPQAPVPLAYLKHHFSLNHLCHQRRTILLRAHGK
jgi:hypothetical protein